MITFVRIVSIFIVLQGSLSLYAQQNVSNVTLATDSVKTERNFPYFITVQLGMLIHCPDCNDEHPITLTTSIIQGVRIGKKLQTGIGIGFDQYDDYKILPVFGSLAWDIAGNKNTNALFIQFNYGGSKSWTDKSKETYGYDHTTGGRMICALLGYRIKFKKIKISFSAGTKWQRVFTYYQYPSYYYTFRDIAMPGLYNTVTVQQDMNRFIFATTVHF